MPDRRPRLTRAMNHPERILTARLLRAQSITDASARSHLHPRAWARYESTGAPPHLAEKFAAALAFPAGYFSRPPTGVLEVTQAQVVDTSLTTPRAHLEVAAAATALSSDIDTWITDHRASAFPHVVFDLVPRAHTRSYTPTAVYGCRVCELGWPALAAVAILSPMPCHTVHLPHRPTASPPTPAPPSRHSRDHALRVMWRDQPCCGRNGTCGVLRHDAMEATQ